uniref:Peptidase M12B domain-containing protein n=1 Tax=Clytia hemisphaerica TaxID=252671 RepID=A0A7M5WQB7_9CNID
GDKNINFELHPRSWIVVMVTFLCVDCALNRNSGLVGTGRYMISACAFHGLTYTGGMCDGDRSVAVIKADGFNAAFSLAHQIGHSLGIEDDGVGNVCESGQHIMASGSGKAAEAYRWSKCSSDYLQGFLRKNQSNCLDHFTSQSSNRENLELYGNAGNVYDVDSQCQFVLGDGAKACYQADKDQICSELMCLHPIYSNCTKTRKPALDGTSCGKDLWCQTGVCVKKGVRDDLVIDGGWSPWKDYVICSRTCGGGVSYRERVCDQPRYFFSCTVAMCLK